MRDLWKYDTNVVFFLLLRRLCLCGGFATLMQQRFGCFGSSSFLSTNISALVVLHQVLSLTQTFQLYLGSFLCYLAGFILWNLDNHTCPTLQYIRAALPPFLRPFIQVLFLDYSSPLLINVQWHFLPFLKLFIQLHAWWHLLAGYATYLNILHALHQRLTHLR